MPHLRLRSRKVEEAREHSRVPTAEAAAMAAASWVMASPARFAAAEKAARVGRLFGRKSGSIGALPPPLSGWTSSRDVPRPPKETFREWWKKEGRS